MWVEEITWYTLLVYSLSNLHTTPLHWNYGQFQFTCWKAGLVAIVRVFEGEKWRRLDSNLHMHYRMSSPSGSPWLGTSKRSSRHSKKRRENWGFSIFYGDTWAQDEHANWGGANMHASCVAVISGSRFDRFSSYTNYRWGDSGSIFGPNMTAEAILGCLILKNFLGEHPPDPPSLFTRNGRASLK